MRVEEFFQSGTGLTVVRVGEHARSPTPDGLVQLTCNEIQRLFITLVVAA